MLLIPTLIPDTAEPAASVATGVTVKFVAEDAESEPSERPTEYEPTVTAGTVTVAETVPSLRTVEAFEIVVAAPETGARITETELEAAKSVPKTVRAVPTGPLEGYTFTTRYAVAGLVAYVVAQFWYRAPGES
jgi:hypothetical protein